MGISARFLRGGAYRIGRKRKLSHSYNDVISLENLCLAWQEFIVGKKQKKDVQIFSRNLMDNILALREELVNKSYKHGGYESFFVNDPKRRYIHKASVRDRLLHHAIYRILYPFFDRTFIPDSFSCRLDKGTYRAINRLHAMFYQVSQNNTRICWILKCDIRKFFDSIDHWVLLNILTENISDKNILLLLENIIESYRTEILRSAQNGNFSSVSEGRIGLPLGNLTSQLFANVYMNVFDQWVKHKLKVKHYIRYADDFVFLSPDKQYLENVLLEVGVYLKEKLKLYLHPNKVSLKTFSSGMDFLGWVNFPNHRILRKNTENRMFVRTRENPTLQTLESYLGLLKHGNTNKIQERLLMESWIAR